MLSQINILKRLITLRGPGDRADPVSTREREQTMQHMAAGIAYYLADSDESANVRAQALCRRPLHRHGLVPRSELARVPLAQARQSLLEALERGACLLALPFSLAGLGILEALAVDSRLPLILIDSPAVSARRVQFHASVNRLPRCQTRDAIKHVKDGAGQGEAVIYVTFPELHALTPGTTAQASFLGKACRFSILDPLLCMVGVNTLLTIGYSAAVPGARAALVNCDTVAVRSTESAQAMSVLLRWLLGHLETAASSAPDGTLSWPYLYRASMHCYQIQRDNRIKQLDAYFQAWRRSSTGMPDSTYQAAMAQLAALRRSPSIHPQ